MELSLIGKIAIYAIPVIFAITLHEAAHGYIAKYFGDLTAYSQGRVTLNPMRHIDLFGTILVPLLIYFGTKGNFLFGWAKPVPVNFAQLRRPKQDMLWVALAGPLANLVMAILWAFLIKAAVSMPENMFAAPLLMMGWAGITINVVLMLLNLLPLPPLDGGRVAASLLPSNISNQYSKLEPYGLIIILVLLFTGILSSILGPLVGLGVGIISAIFGL